MYNKTRHNLILTLLQLKEWLCMSKRRVVIDPDGKELLIDENIKDYITPEPVPADSEVEYVSGAAEKVKPK